MRFLVTGVGGFIASHIAKRLIDEGHTVIGVDDFSGGKLENVPQGVDLITHDLADPGVAKLLPRDINAILHLAGQSSGEISFDNPLSDLNKNVASTLNLIAHGIEAGVQRLVYASSMSVYGNITESLATEDGQCRPLSCYGNGKLAAERYLKIYEQQLPYVSYRMFNVYGPGQDLSNLRQGMISIYVAQALEKNAIDIKGSLTRFRDFIYIDDVVEAWVQSAVSDKTDGSILNLGTGQRTTIQELMEIFCHIFPGMSYRTIGGTPGDQTGIVADTYNLGRLTGIENFVPLEEGLARFIEWAKNQ